MASGETTPNATTAELLEIPSVYRAVIHDHLVRLVSTGTAELYGDACKHMDRKPPLATTTHTVANLLREVESSMRAVLRPLASIENEQICETCKLPTSDIHCKCGRPKLESHKTQIAAILAALGITEAPIKDGWEYVASKGSKYTHRNNLDSPRSVDEEFMEYWSQMESVLTGVLDRFETEYINVFDKLDELIAKPTPTVQDAKTFCSNFPSNQTTHDYFFARLKNPAWLPLLRRKDIFKKVPNIIHYEDGGFRYPAWPPTQYLLQMATQNPEEVRDILQNIESTENRMVMDSLIEIATALPEAQQLTLVEKLKTWI